VSVTEHDHPVDADRVAAVRERLIDAEEASRLTGLLGLLADATRIRLLYALDTAGDELCVGDLALALDASEDAVSYALRLLRTSGLVTGRRSGRMVMYRLADGFPEPLRNHCLRALVELSRRTPEED
jgi:DNA-binding transcriptional ArsR family regulator